jgi:hypothetical protein
VKFEANKVKIKPDALDSKKKNGPAGVVFANHRARDVDVYGQRRRAYVPTGRPRDALHSRRVRARARAPARPWIHLIKNKIKPSPVPSSKKSKKKDMG